MNNEILIHNKIFFRFLKEHNSYAEFMKNFILYSNKINRKENYFLNTSTYNYLIDSFGWRNSKYKKREWAMLDSKWIELFDKKTGLIIPTI